jgi:hypothetical protein
MTTTVHQPPPGPPAGPTSPRPIGRAIGRAVAVAAGFLLILAGVVLAMFLWRESAYDVVETSTTHADVNRVQLDLRAVGDVELVIAERDDVLVEKRVETTGRGIDVDESVAGGTLTVSSTRCPNDWFILATRCAASFVIHAPPGTELMGAAAHGALTLDGPTGSVDVSTRHGDVDARGIVGPAHLETRHGNVTVTGVEGAVTLDTRHGNVEVVDPAGTVRVTSGHGRVAVRGGEGDLHLDTRHGSIIVSGTRSGTAEMTTRFGDVEFHPGSAPTPVRIETSHGDVDVRLPADAPAYAVSTSASGAARVEIATDPDSDHHLDVRTRHGTITVEPAGS